jgi:ubiquinone/menaquinone biosynthesis C-methylase UbiE
MLGVACASAPEKPTPEPPPKAEHVQKHIPHHRFDDVERYAKRWDSKERDAWQNPEAVVAALALAPNAQVADIGAGTGYFSLRFAQALPQGKVLAIDVEEKMLAHIKQRAEESGLSNVQTVLAGPSDPKIEGQVDVIFLCNTYHHIGSRSDYFGALKKHLAPGGRLVVVDFKVDQEIPVGPPVAMRISPEQMTQELVKGGYVRASLDRETLPHQYIAVYQPAPQPAL